jgi:hypothetical protein
MRHAFVLSFFALSVASLSGCSGTPAAEPVSEDVSASTNEPSTTETKRLGDPVVGGTVDWDCYDTCMKAHDSELAHKYCTSACTK